MAAPVSTSSGVAGWILFAISLVGSSIIIIVQLMCLVVSRRRHATAIDKQNKYVSLFAVLHSWIN